MSIESDLFAALNGLVANRVYRDSFVQNAAGALPQWPAIRFTRVGGTIWPDICGSGTEETDDVRVQIDAAAPTRDGRDALRLSVRTAMLPLSPLAVLDGPPISEYDELTKTFRASMDFIFYGSSAA